MAKFETVPVEKLKAVAGLSPDQLKKLEQYKTHLKKLNKNTGGVLTPERGEDIKTVRADLRRAAKALGIELTIKSSGKKLSFYLKEPTRKRRGRPKKKRRPVTY
jgi:hypothetical protein